MQRPTCSALDALVHCNTDFFFFFLLIISLIEAEEKGHVLEVEASWG